MTCRRRDYAFILSLPPHTLPLIFPLLPQVILVPLLIHAPSLNIPPHEAIVSCMFSYIFVSISGMFAYSRHASINWDECAFLLYSATPAAFAAAASLNLFSEWLLKMILYSVMLISSVFSLRTLIYASRETHVQVPMSDGDVEERQSFDSGFRNNNSSPLDSPPALAASEDIGMETEEILIDLEGPATVDPLTGCPLEVDKAVTTTTKESNAAVENVTKYKMWALGATTGFLSPLTGTSGPVVFLPLALTVNCPILNALGAAQAVQLPIASAATLTFVLTSKVNVALGLALAVGSTPCVILGSSLAHRIKKFHLQVIVTTVLIVASVVLFGVFLFG